MSNRIAKSLGSIYRILWTNTTRRPWTYAMRQTAIETPWKVWIAHLVILPLLALIYVYWPWYFGLPVIAFTFALWGHLFWDTLGAYVKHARYFEGGD